MREAFDQLLPEWLESRPEETRESSATTFSCGITRLDRMALHPQLVAFAQQLLGTDSVTLAHSIIWCKQAGGDDWSRRGFDQPLHGDYEGNTLVVPDLANLDPLATITYYTDATVDLGPTCVASLPDSHRLADDCQDGDEVPADLLSCERPVTVPAGLTLLYTMGIFHRGSAFRVPAGKGVTHHVAFQRADITWGIRNHPVESGPRIAAMLSALSPKQRSVLGFPAPGHPYWTPDNVAAVARRYPDMDMAPYIGPRWRSAGGRPLTRRRLRQRVGQREGDAVHAGRGFRGVGRAVHRRRCPALPRGAPAQGGPSPRTPDAGRQRHRARSWLIQAPCLRSPAATK